MLLQFSRSQSVWWPYIQSVINTDFIIWIYINVISRICRVYLFGLVTVHDNKGCTVDVLQYITVYINILYSSSDHTQCHATRCELLCHAMANRYYSSKWGFIYASKEISHGLQLRYSTASNYRFQFGLPVWLLWHFCQYFTVHITLHAVTRTIPSRCPNDTQLDDSSLALQNVRG